MSTISTPPTSLTGTVTGSALPDPFRLSVAQYDAMIDKGILTGQDKVELVAGGLYRKMPKKGHHSIASRETFKALDRLLPPGYFATREDPIRIPDHDEPEPDISIVRGWSRDFSIQPGAADVALVAEVADATLAFDRGPKLLAYAKGSIPVYWIVNLIAAQLEVYTAPSGPSDPVGYRRCTVRQPGEAVEVVIDDQVVGQIAVADLLP